MVVSSFGMLDPLSSIRPGGGVAVLIEADGWLVWSFRRPCTVKVSLELVVTLLAHIHQVAVVQGDFRLADVGAVEGYFVVDDEACPLMAYLAQSAVSLYPLCNIR